MLSILPAVQGAGSCPGEGLSGAQAPRNSCEMRGASAPQAISNAFLLCKGKGWGTKPSCSTAAAGSPGAGHTAGERDANPIFTLQPHQCSHRDQEACGQHLGRPGYGTAATSHHLWSPLSPPHHRSP